MHPYRTHNCGELRPEHVGETVRLSGWVHRKRDHGQLLFIDLRDHFGITQIVFQPEHPFFAEAEGARLESVLTVTGRVVARSPETVNPKLATGEVEVVADALVVESPAEQLPLQVNAERDYPEETRLRYRFLDLRREAMQQNILLRSKVISSIRRRMEAQGFVEFQTPILTASSPEGARDFLVPSRLHPGKFYALPQAPQQYKQLLMIVGLRPLLPDRALLSRRGRARRPQPGRVLPARPRDGVRRAGGRVRRGRAGDAGLFAEFTDWEVTPLPFPRIPYRDALRAFGTDKPDLRNPLLIADVTDAFRGSEFKVFARLIESDGKARVWAIPAPGGGSRAFCDRMNGWAQGEGQPGLGYIFWRDGEDGGAGPIAKNLGPERTAADPRLRARATAGWARAGSRRAYFALRPTGLQPGDAVFFVAGLPATDGEVRSARPAARIAEELGLIAERCYRFAWIVDFPMYEWDEQTKPVTFSHNPFSMPQGGLEALESKDPLEILAYQYDIVCNGVELSLGRDPQPSPRHHGQGVRARRLRARRAGGALRRHVPRVALRRAAARRHRARHRPDRDADRRPAEPARGHRLPAQSAGPGAGARRALAGRRQAAQGAPPPALAGRARAAARGARARRPRRPADHLVSPHAG